MTEDLFSKQLKGFQKDIELELDRWLVFGDVPVRLAKAMRMSVKAGGKRLRPLMLVGAHRMFNGRANPLPAAVAVELVHTYSLIHDDLPAMDDSPLRRGQPTCHVAFDEATAILAGDGLLAYAFEILSQGYESDPSLAIGLVRLLAKASGPAMLVGGQMDDILLEKGTQKVSMDEIQRIEERKTGALFSATLCMGAMMSDSGRACLPQMERLGRLFGRAFQIADDVLDVIGNEELTGKPVGADARNLKPTAVDEWGLDGARVQVAEITAECMELCFSCRAPFPEFLVDLMLSMRDRVL
mgnify:FL=1